MAEVKGFKHEDGRECTWVSAAGVWMHWVQHDDPEDDDFREACYRTHNERPLHDYGDGTVDVMVPTDRGEFGMPGVGMAATLIMPPPEHEWKATLTDAGLGVEFTGKDGEKGYGVEATTDDAKYIMQILPEIIGHFLTKNTQYARAQTGHDLGVKGIIPDVNRKTSALITRFWDRTDHLPREGEDDAEELMDDLIGHLLLMRAKMRDA